MKQKDVFLGGEGDAWFERNKDKLGQDDPVTHCIAAHIGKKPEKVLEVGCANGWRLAKIRDLYGCEVYGCDPSIKAWLHKASERIPIYHTTASCPPYLTDGYDLIIYGFCLYLTDPDDWLLIAAEGDRALRPGGHIIIHDFGDLGNEAGNLYGVPYEHDQRVTSWHYDWAKLWLGHPGYTMTHRHWTAPESHPDRQSVTILRKEPVHRHFSITSAP